MLICVYLDFDNTLFPSDYMATFFSAKEGKFEKVSATVVDTLYIVDSLISKFLYSYMHSCRFRILTHATPTWVMYSLQTFMPNLYRYIEWNYIQVIYCENLSKADVVRGFLSKEKMFDMYITCGDKQTDLSSVYMPVKEKLKLGAQIRQILFVNKPNLNAYEYQWTCMPDIFAGFVNSPNFEIRRHFVDSDITRSSKEDLTTKVSLKNNLSVVEEQEEFEEFEELHNMEEVKPITILSTLSLGTPPSHSSRPTQEPTLLP